MQIAAKRIAFYQRTSSDEQREKATIRTQADVLRKALETEPTLRLVDEYIDDGVSGTRPMSKRPAGARLLKDAEAGKFDELWVYKIDRLGRDEVDPIVVWKQLLACGVTVFSVTEGVNDLFTYSIRVTVAAHERRTFRERSEHGMVRCVEEGRFPGGIVSYGYRIEGRRPTGRLVPDDRPVWNDWSAVDVITWVFDRAAYDGWSDHKIALALNTMGVPTSYAKDERQYSVRDETMDNGKRKVTTQGLWGYGRVGQLLTNTTYRGLYLYRKKSKKPTIEVAVTPLVSDEVWYAAQETRRANRFIPTNTDRVYLLRSVLTCGDCGHALCGTWHTRDHYIYYRCTGATARKNYLKEPCKARGVRGELLEAAVWEPIERWLRNPADDLLQELIDAGDSGKQQAASAEHRVVWERRLEEIAAERQRTIAMARKGIITEDDLTAQLAILTGDQVAVQGYLDHLDAEPEPVVIDAESRSLLEELRGRVDELTPAQKHEIVALLAKVTVHTEGEGRARSTRAVIEFRFPSDLGVAATCRDRGSWRSRA